MFQLPTFFVTEESNFQLGARLTLAGRDTQQHQQQQPTYLRTTTCIGIQLYVAEIIIHDAK